MVLSAYIWQLVIVCGSEIESCSLLGTDGVPAADSSPAEKKFSGESLLNENELVGNGKATKVDNDSVKSRLIPRSFFSSAFVECP